MSIDKVYGCADGTNTFGFIDRSWNDTITKLEWTFSNGASNANPTSTIAGSLVYSTFTQPGWVTATLSATGNNTGVGTTTRTPIYATDPTPIGDYDDLFSPLFDLSSPVFSTNCNLNFYTSGGFMTSNYMDMTDTLEIAYSINCGSKWMNIATVSKLDLGNNGAVLYNYTPPSGHLEVWKLQSIPVPAAAKSAGKAMFRFRYRHSVFVSNPNNNYPMGSGNNFYLDRIHFSKFPTGINDDKMKIDGLALSPNPTNTSTTLIINGGEGIGKVIVTDITGKMIYQAEQQLTNDITRIEIPANVIAAKGIYLVKFSSNNKSETQKLITY